MKTFFKISLWWLAIFIVSYMVLSSFHLVPLEFRDLNAQAAQVLFQSLGLSQEGGPASVIEAEAPVKASMAEKKLPDRIVIDRINVDSVVLNPESSDINVLDAALLKGVVRYPHSGGLDDNSNMLLFGHSTGFRSVYNEAFKAFNRIGELQVGDLISVESEGISYVYRVFSVSQVSAEKELIEFRTGEKMITLTTCDSFGKKSDRFVVQARFVHALPSESVVE